jgi:hypothetical protein
MEHKRFFNLDAEGELRLPLMVRARMSLRL